MKKKKEGKRIFRRLKKSLAFYLFIFLLVLNIVLGGLDIAKAKGMLIPEQPEPLVVEGMVDLDKLTLQQKIGQMVVGIGVEYYAEAIQKMQLGGIHLHAMSREEVFRKTVGHFQEGMEIPFMVTVDLEGCINPFASFRQFKAASEINNLGEAFEKGKTEGKFLKDLGVSIDFSPVVDLRDEIWKCRSFPGEAGKISELANAYLLGLQDEGIMGTAKHYPGKTLVIKDPHEFLAAAEITEEDLYPYIALMEKGTVKAIMVSHLITFGKVNSEGKPSVASSQIIAGLREKGFKGLVITDEINMKGVRNFYDSPEEMYKEVFKGGADIILNFNKDPNEIYAMIKIIEKAVQEGEIAEERIDESVKKILEFKGLKVER